MELAILEGSLVGVAAIIGHLALAVAVTVIVEVAFIRAPVAIILEHGLAIRTDTLGGE